MNKRSIGLDRNIRELVTLLNEFPGIKPYASCGGHTKTEGRIYPAKKGTFYVNFATPLEDPDGSVASSISVIEKVIRQYNGAVTLEQAIFPDKLEHRFWSLTGGKGVNPRVLAYELYSALLKTQEKAAKKK